MASVDLETAKRAKTFVVMMGLVAMFGDMTYEGARGRVGPYLNILGASATVVGFVAGLGEFVGYGLRLATGWLADRWKSYWLFVALGYSVNLVAVPGLALVGDWPAAIALIVLERMGKAIRSPSRSALVSYAAQSAGVGKSFGIDEALDQLGAFLGPMITAGVVWGLRSEPAPARLQTAFAVLLLPVIANLLMLALAKRKFPRPDLFETRTDIVRVHYGSSMRLFLVAASFMALGFADWALIAFHVNKTTAIDLALLPVIYAGVMGVDAVSALVLGAYFDRRGLWALVWGVAASAGFAPLVFWFSNSYALLGGAVLWAIGLGAQESIFKAAIAQMVPKNERAKAYGQFFAVFGCAWWLGSALMGWAYDRSIMSVVAFSVTTQLISAALFGLVARRAQT